MPTNKIPSHPKGPYFFNKQTKGPVDITITESQISDLDHYDDADFDTRLATKDTDDLAEGSNLYYTQARFDTAFTGKDTDDLAEGANLYFTNARADARIALATLDDLAEADAADLSGTLADARLSSNVPLLDAENSFTAVQTFLTRSRVGAGTGEARFDLNSSSSGGFLAGLAFLSGSSPDGNRWIVFKDTRAEAGSNAGSNFNVFRYPDAGGAPLGMSIFIERATGNTALLGGTLTALPNFQNGVNIMYLRNGTAPSGNPSAGGFLYIDSGALKYRGSSGTVTTIAAA